MSAVRVPDILYRISASMLAKYQSLMVAGAGRGGNAPLPFTHTRADATSCARYADKDTLLKIAAANKLRIDWPSGLVDANGNAIGGVQSEGSRINSCLQSEVLGTTWTTGNASISANATTAPDGTTTMDAVVENTATATHRVQQAITITSGQTVAISGFAKANSRTKFDLTLRDAAETNGFGADFDASTGLFIQNRTAGAGAVQWKTAHAVSGGYRVIIVGAVNGGVTAATMHFRLHDAANAISYLGDGASNMYFWGAQAELGNAIPSSYLQTTTAAVTRAADALTTPVNWGAIDQSWLIRLARPLHADASGALGVSPGIFSLGAGTAPRIGCYFDPAARNIISAIDTATTDSTQTVAIPAGQPTICIQYRNLTTGGQTRIDAGSGFTAWSSAATAFSAFSSQTLRVGRYDDELYGVIGDMIVARGVDFTRAEMMAVL